VPRSPLLNAIDDDEGEPGYFALEQDGLWSDDEDLPDNPKSGSWVIATMGRIGAFDGHEHNSFDAFASPGG
jgi:hypothetical protein